MALGKYRPVPRPIKKYEVAREEYVSAYLSKNRDVIKIKKPSAMDRLYPIRGDTTPDRSKIRI